MIMTMHAYSKMGGATTIADITTEATYDALRLKFFEVKHLEIYLMFSRGKNGHSSIKLHKPLTSYFIKKCKPPKY
jgi:hypothetical protein